MMVLLSLFIGISLQGFGQNEVKEIRFEGLKRTKPDHLIRFIRQKVGEDLNEEFLREDVERLSTLISVSNASIDIEKRSDGILLTIQVEEAWTLFPIVFFGGIRENIWAQIGASEQNLFGRGIQATAIYRNTDRRHNGQLYLRIPYLGGSRWGMAVNLLSWASVEPLYFGDTAVFYRYDNRLIGLSGIHEFKFGHRLEFEADYFVETYEKDGRHEGQSTPGPERERIPKLLLKVIHNLNRLKYHYYSISGWDIRQNAQVIYDLWDNGGEPFYIYLLDCRHFKEFGKRRRGNLASRLRFGISVNRESPFAPFVLDSQVNIRGSGNRIDRGTGMIVWNLEYRWAVWDSRNFASQLVGFSDAGTWRTPGGDLSQLYSKETFQHFIGGGVRLIFKKAFNAVIRVDYGTDWRNPERKGLVVGVGQYF